VKKNIEDIKNRLLARKEELEKSFSNRYKQTNVDMQAQDVADQAFSSTIEELQISIHNNELDEYNRILKAIEMINNNRYGICIDCDQDISPKRLERFPNATRCLPCQEILEGDR
jgi:DnaK suppressor protein